MKSAKLFVHAMAALNDPARRVTPKDDKDIDNYFDALEKRTGSERRIVFLRNLKQAILAGNKAKADSLIEEYQVNAFKERPKVQLKPMVKPFF